MKRTFLWVIRFMFMSNKEMSNKERTTNFYMQNKEISKKNYVLN